MHTIQSKSELREVIKAARREGKTIGLVPTMGFLHQGHISLMNRARSENNLIVVSIFVNPTQFSPNEDLDAYPRDVQRDSDMMASVPVDIAFFPTVETIYPKGFTTFVEVEGPMTKVLCGRTRPTHFKGVTTVVAKLFNLVTPDRAYFGRKDAQQAAVIQQMVRDLNFDLQVTVCPIFREPDGLAMSSRNTYLTPEQRKRAPVLYRALCDAKVMVEKGERRASAILQFIEARIKTVEGAVIEYVEVVNGQTMAPLESMKGEVLIALAVRFGKTRLIDNIQIMCPYRCPMVAS